MTIRSPDSGSKNVEKKYFVWACRFRAQSEEEHLQFFMTIPHTKNMFKRLYIFIYNVSTWRILPSSFFCHPEIIAKFEI